ncbi:MAG: hypothetical protein GY899_05290, partial [Verrucomicrobiaceae bacterium]|nr:hypothetical protein [Verrucomicrobiaceae bacterium]
FDDEDTADTLSFTATGMPSTMSMSTAGVLSGTPVNADVGDHTVIVTAEDDGTGTLTVTDTFVLTVTNTNDAPTVTGALSAASIAEDASYSLDVSSMCTDVDVGDALAYTMSGAPSTLSIASGTISGTPLNADVGTHTITVTCTDDGTGTLSASDSYVLTVTNTDDATTGSVTITGDSYDGATLTADTSGLADDDGIGSFTYQWANQDGDITGAESSTYTIPSCDTITDGCSTFGNTYTVNVTHIDAYTVSQVMSTSAATSGVTLNPAGDLDGDSI